MKKMAPRIYALMLKLTDGERTCQQIADESGLCKLTVYHYLKALHQAKLVHVADWERDSAGRYSLRLFRFGPGIDAKPPRVDNKRRCQQYRERRAQQDMLQRLAA